MFRHHAVYGVVYGRQIVVNGLVNVDKKQRPAMVDAATGEGLGVSPCF
jgi:hypothetical protein